MIQSRLGFKWDARGDDARIADTSNQMELTITVGPGHLKLSHAKRKGLFILRFMTFDGFGRQLPEVMCTHIWRFLVNIHKWQYVWQKRLKKRG